MFPPPTLQPLPFDARHLVCSRPGLQGSPCCSTVAMPRCASVHRAPLRLWHPAAGHPAGLCLCPGPGLPGGVSTGWRFSVHRLGSRCARQLHSSWPSQPQTTLQRGPADAFVLQRVRCTGHRLDDIKAEPPHAGQMPPLVLSAVLLILLAGGAAARVAFLQHSASSVLARPAAHEPLDSAPDTWQPEACPAGAAPLEWDTNLAAMLAATALRFWPASAGWWVDPAAAIAISLVLMGRWAAIARTQVGSRAMYGCMP